MATVESVISQIHDRCVRGVILPSGLLLSSSPFIAFPGPGITAVVESHSTTTGTPIADRAFFIMRPQRPPLPNHRTEIAVLVDKAISVLQSDDRGGGCSCQHSCMSQ